AAAQSTLARPRSLVWRNPVATENHILAGTAAALGYSHRRDDRPLDAARWVARRTVEIACGSRSRDGISPPAACCPEAVGAGEAQAAHCRSPDLRLALSAVPLLALSRGCVPALDPGGLASERGL